MSSELKNTEFSIFTEISHAWCMYVCVYVCACVETLQPKRMGRFWWNFLQMIWQIFARPFFLGFWNFEIDDVMAAILHFFSGALSRSQFCFNFLQNCREGRKLSSADDYFNQRDRLVTSGNMADRVFEKKSKWPPWRHDFKNSKSKKNGPRKYLSECL